MFLGNSKTRKKNSAEVSVYHLANFAQALFWWLL